MRSGTYLHRCVRECAACGMPWPCPAEIGAIVAAIGRES
ncbi:hypothetical protein HNR73_002995 [Phytomonospora endophytica]|uniref:Uncharacterized protein n=1 Tax=Phytomonospora endophytica TaxID=714109 RepID=A0A841FMW2_9ACTN|nr:hypothetical protein [Phytomonospora endophytica]